MVWPSLVVVEAVSATVFLLLLTVLSVLVSAPLTARANPNQTPNPSKAPWYFLNLQELLLHLDPGLAGVTLPTIALGAIAAIPYIDRSPLGVGILGTSAKGRKIIAVSTVYTTVVLVAAIYLDALSDETRFGLSPYIVDSGVPFANFIDTQVVPVIFILGAIGVLVGIVHAMFRPTRRELIIALFTGFVITFLVLTISGTSFRGEGQELTWPWNLPLEHH